MEVIIERDSLAASRTAARYIARLIQRKPNAVLGLAAGVTPIQLYAELVRLHQEDDLDFSEVATFSLDEFVGVGEKNPGSYQSFMREQLFKHVNLKPHNIHMPDGQAKSIPKMCAAYEAAITEAGGIDLQILGIGVQGHIGFNEPSSSLASRTRIKTLAPRTRAELAPQFGSELRVPQHVVTMGIGTVMDSRECMLMAFGHRKASAIAAAVEGPVTSMTPASILQMHAAVKVLLDEPAATDLKNRAYYRWVYDHKPEWQRF